MGAMGGGMWAGGGIGAGGGGGGGAGAGDVCSCSCTPCIACARFAICWRMWSMTFCSGVGWAAAIPWSSSMVKVEEGRVVIERWGCEGRALIFCQGVGATRPPNTPNKIKQRGIDWWELRHDPVDSGNPKISKLRKIVRSYHSYIPQHPFHMLLAPYSSDYRSAY